MFRATTEGVTSCMLTAEEVDDLLREALTGRGIIIPKSAKLLHYHDEGMETRFTKTLEYKWRGDG